MFYSCHHIRRSFRDGVGPSPKDGTEPAWPPSKSATDYRSSFAAANQVVTLTRVTNDRVIIIIIIIIIIDILEWPKQ